MKTSFSFLADSPSYLSEKPYELWFPEDQMPADFPQTNCEFVIQTGVEVEDVRDSTVQPTLISSGFQYFHSLFKTELTAVDLLSGGNSSIQQYLLDTTELVKEKVTAEKVICFDWRYRKSQPTSSNHNGMEYDVGRRTALRPAQHVHSDDSPKGGLDRLSRHLNNDELERFNSGALHIQFINVWRPLVSAVEDSPLALCDRRTVSPDDLVACDKIHPDHTNEGLYLKYRPAHRWYWLSKQSKDEPVMFITWDSDSKILPAGPPHASFQNPAAGSWATPRESVEVRLMVLGNPWS